MEGTPLGIDNAGEVSDQDDFRIAKDSTSREAPLTESVAAETKHEVANDDIDENELRLESNKTTKE